ncbi:MAG: DUF3461 family protein [Proteobacteria bacterium]|nr:DUF3461 family protein [Pseudomonadota bacterium]
MKKHTNLIEMGVVNPKQIARFTVHEADNVDVLRVIYSRKKGSILPMSKTFKFPRIKKSVLVDGGTRQTQIVYESAPVFANAIIELDEIIEKNSNVDELNQILEDEILQLEAEVTSRIDYIKMLIAQRPK